MDPRTLRRKILRWYDLRGRELPWRRTRNPYRIFVSEYMLQQTQVARVLVIYPRWLKSFPTFRSLARATRREAIVAWSGMGYNRRALYLKRAAELVVEKFGGRLPEEISLLRSLPGVGEYTSSALACFVFGQRVPVIDVNVRRVLSRIVGAGAIGAQHAAPLLPRKRFYDWNQALMDLGAMVCTARNPECPSCPARGECASRDLYTRTTPLKKIGMMRPPVPRRIYRGRVVEYLRNRPAGASFGRIGKLLFPIFADAERRKLADILASLIEDGLLHARRGRSRPAAPRRSGRKGIRYHLAE